MRAIEFLEDRKLFAATCALDASGNLVITSDTAGDTIVVKEQFGQATVTINGKAAGTFSPLTRVKINGNGGNDIITYTGYSIGADIFAGDGADTVNLYDYRTGTTTGFSTVSGGVGADKIIVYAGQYATIHGDGDIDTITVNAGSYLKIYGDAGADAISIASTNAKYTTVYKDSVDKVTNKGTSTTIVAV